MGVVERSMIRGGMAVRRVTERGRGQDGCGSEDSWGGGG